MKRKIFQKAKEWCLVHWRQKGRIVFVLGVLTKVTNLSLTVYQEPSDFKGVNLLKSCDNSQRGFHLIRKEVVEWRWNRSQGCTEVSKLWSQYSSVVYYTVSVEAEWLASCTRAQEYQSVPLFLRTRLSVSVIIVHFQSSCCVLSRNN
jgi:hypothetical protein